MTRHCALEELEAGGHLLSSWLLKVKVNYRAASGVNLLNFYD